MKYSHFRERFQELVKDPSALLAYFALRRSMKESGLPVWTMDSLFSSYRSAFGDGTTRVLLNSETEEWGEPRTKVRLASAPKRKGSVETRPSIFDLLGLKILIATHIGEVPKDVRFVASRIVSLQAPIASKNQTERTLIAKRRIDDQYFPIRCLLFQTGPPTHR